MSGPLPIKYTEMKAFMELCGEYLEPWEVTCIRVMDIALLDAVAELQAKEQK